MHQEGKWYILYVIAKTEQTVVHKIKSALEMKIGEKYTHFLKEITIPKTKTSSFKNNQKQETESTAFPGYIAIRLILDNTVISLINNIPEVRGFLLDSERKPKSISDDEYNKMMSNVSNVKTSGAKETISIGNIVTILEGEFKDFDGTVISTNFDTGYAIVRVTIFGKETDITMQFSGLKRLEKSA